MHSWAGVRSHLKHVPGQVDMNRQICVCLQRFENLGEGVAWSGIFIRGAKPLWLMASRSACCCCFMLCMLGMLGSRVQGRNSVKPLWLSTLCISTACMLCLGSMGATCLCNQTQSPGSMSPGLHAVSAGSQKHAVRALLELGVNNGSSVNVPLSLASQN